MIEASVDIDNNEIVTITLSLPDAELLLNELGDAEVLVGIKLPLSIIVNSN